MMVHRSAPAVGVLKIQPTVATSASVPQVGEQVAGPYLGFFVCGGKLGFREISDQYSYKKQPSKIRHYVRKKTFSFPSGGNCPLRPPAMYGPEVVLLNCNFVHCLHHCDD